MSWFKAITLTTRRKSGEPYTVPLRFHVEGGSLWIVSSMGLESYWARHILRDPRVVAVVGKGSVTYRIEGLAEIRSDKGLLKSIATEIYRKYYGWLDHEAVRDWCRGAALVELRPKVVERQRAPNAHTASQGGSRRGAPRRGHPRAAAKGI